jgi:hypothetical protein
MAATNLVPTVARAREAIGVLDSRGDPSEVRALAAIVLAIHGLRRESWTHVVNVSDAAYERLSSDMPAVPSDFADHAYQIIDAREKPRRIRCTGCFITPGRMPCTLCGGSGERDHGLPCLGRCERGSVVCSECDGKKSSWRVRLRHVNDSHLGIRRVFVPMIEPSLADSIERWVGDGARAVRDELRFDLQPSLVASAYRGAEAVRAPEFEGCSFGDALERAVDASRELDKYRGIIRSDVRAYACPFLWLRYAAPIAHGAIVVIDASGEPCLLD